MHKIVTICKLSSLIILKNRIKTLSNTLIDFYKSVSVYENLHTIMWAYNSFTCLSV